MGDRTQGYYCYYLRQRQIRAIIILQPMLVGNTQEELERWKAEMYQYQKSKRTKKPFGREVPAVHHVTDKEVKQQQTAFNPVLQTFKFKEDEAKVAEKESYQRARSLADQLKQQAKHEKPYDIINLYSFTDQPSKPVPERMNQVPLRTNYNIVSNQPLPDYYYKNRALKLNPKHDKKGIVQQPRQYNIITNVYKDNDQQKKEEEWKDFQRKQEQKYWKTHDYNHVNGKYYDLNKEEEYQEQLEREMREHGKTQKNKLPPSYLQRIPVVVDPSKEIPEEAKAVEQRMKNAKKRYETKYIVEKQYQDRNFEEYLKQESIIKNKPHQKRILDDQNKEFNIINLRDNKKETTQSLYGKKPLASTWDKVMLTKNAYSDAITFGKNGGL